MAGLYVHIPFCAKACPYCDFAFVVGRDSLHERYVDAVLSEMESRLPGFGQPIETIYFGGGTPSSLSPKLLSEIVAKSHALGSVRADAEITVEANPNDHERFKPLRDVGVTRLSLGIQSTDDDTLLALSRTHTGTEALEAVKQARSAGFDNINVDAIFSAPHQSVELWKRDLSQILSMDPEHTSIYGLTIEPRTPYAKMEAAGELDLPEEGSQAEMYEIAQDLTSQAGLEQYEISNYAKPGFESRHNLSCWRGESYLGIGMSAHSYDGSLRSWNVRRLNDYLARIEAGDSAEDGREILAEDERRTERIMLGMRTREGVEQKLLPVTDRLRRLLSEELIERSGKRLRLTRRGKSVADLVCAELVRDE